MMGGKCPVHNKPCPKYIEIANSPGYQTCCCFICPECGRGNTEIAVCTCGRGDAVVEKYIGLGPKTKKRYGHPRFYELVDEISELHSRKNHDYATDEDPLSNFKQVAKAVGVEPWVVGMMFIAEKFYRLVNLIERGDVKNESKEDTLSDMAVYALITRILMEES